MEIMKIAQISINKMNMIAPNSVHDFLFSAFYQAPVAYLERTTRKHGDISRVRLGRSPFYLINHPDYIQMILTDENDRFSWKAYSNINRYDKAALEVEQTFFSIILNSQPEHFVISDQLKDEIIQTTRQFTNRWNVRQKIDIYRTSKELSKNIFLLLNQDSLLSFNKDLFIPEDRFMFELVNNILYWCLYFLARDQLLQEQIPNQDSRRWFSHYGDHEENDKNLSRFIIYETLRLSPPVWILTRSVQQLFELGGFHFSEEDRILISPWLMQRDARFVKDPQRFDPFRWDSTLVLGGKDFCYFPFGNSNINTSQFTINISNFISLIIETIFSEWNLVLIREITFLLKPKGIFLYPVQDVQTLTKKR